MSESKPQIQPNNPLHGVKLKDVVDFLVEEYGFEALGERIQIRCFTHNPTKKSTLVFLRKHQWARDKVERLYLNTLEKIGD